MKKLLAVLMTVMVTSCAFAAESTAWPLSAETVPAPRWAVKKAASVPLSAERVRAPRWAVKKAAAVPAPFMIAVQSFRNVVKGNLPEKRAIDEQHSQNMILQSIMMPMDTFNEYLKNNRGNTDALKEMAREFTKLGYYIALGGALTFKNARHSVEVAESVDEKYLLTETDCPYMTPVPFRGKRNEPCFIPYILKKMADVRGVSEEHMAQTVIDNFHRYLGNR